MAVMSEAAGTARAPLFELSGGTLCLDFANTWGDRARPETDRLRSYEALPAFARQTDVVPAPPAPGSSSTRAATAPAAGARWRVAATAPRRAGITSDDGRAATTSAAGAPAARPRRSLPPARAGRPGRRAPRRG